MIDSTPPGGGNESALFGGVGGDLDQVESSMAWIESHPVRNVPTTDLVVADSPRLGGTDEAYVRTLADAGGLLPPIIVHRPTMKVIDGLHRLRAAILNGRSTIEARLVECDDRAAFVLSVKANAVHGLPLRQKDKVSAAARIIEAYPQWSDRAVAAATSLSGKTISKIRRQYAQTSSGSCSRLGQDGRVRPLDTGRQREHAASLLREQPGMGLREAARATGLSPATVRDVRARIAHGEDPVPGRYRLRTTETPAGPVARPVSEVTPSVPSAVVHPASGNLSPTELMARLSRDPSLRMTESGRYTLGLLQRYAADPETLAGVGSGLPEHWMPLVAGMALDCARAWRVLAEELSRQATDVDDAAAG